jgi:hypothetical protein
MSEYNAPNLVNTYVSAAILTNITPGSIMLQTQSVSSDESLYPAISQFKDSESVLYNAVVVSDTTSSGYNADIMQNYITNGVLSTSIITPQPPVGSIQGLTGSTHTISVSNSQLVKQSSTNKQDTLEIYYSLSVDNIGTSLVILVYRGLNGLYYSINSGKTIVAIPTSGMSYPNEITSIAVQNVVSVVTPGSIKIWAGTLREGLLSYTLGSPSWVSETDNDQISGNYIFKHTLITNTVTPTNTPISTSIIPQTYAPVYILGIVNNPVEAGEPIAVYTKPLTTTQLGVVSTFTASFSGSSLTLTSNTGASSSLINQTITGAGIPTGVIVGSLVSGTDNISGAVYTLNTTVGNIASNSVQATIISTISTVKNIYTVYKYTATQYYSYILNTTYNLYKSVVLPLSVSSLPALPNTSYPIGFTISNNSSIYTNVSNVWTLTTTGYSWTLFTNPFTNEVCDIIKSIPYSTSYGMTNTSKVITAVATYSSSSSSYITELIYLSINNDVNYGNISRQLTITKDTSIGSSIVINPNQFTGLSYFNSDIFITTRNQIFRYLNGSWSSWLLASDTTTKERNLNITSSYGFSLTNPISYITGLRGFGVIQGTSSNVYYGILNTDLGTLVITCNKTSSDYLSPIVGSKAIRTDLFGTSLRDLQSIPEVNNIFGCGLITEPINRYILPTSYGASIRYSKYVPQITSKLPNSIGYNYNQIFYKNYLVGTDTLPYFINQFNDYDLPSENLDQLYINTENATEIQVLKSLYSTFSYIDTTNTFNWLNDSVTATYLSKSIKYNRLKILLQTRQTISLINATLSSNLEIPFIPDVDF